MNLKLFFAVAMFAVFCVAGTAFAMTDQERQALIQQIQQQIAQLQAQIIQLQNITFTPSDSSGAADSTAACAGVTFTRNLTVGSTGSDVKCLQQILNQSATTKVATTGAGSPGNETTYFGSKTLAAVKVYQAAQGFTPANQVGPLTKQVLNVSLVGLPTPTTTPTTTPFSCSPNWSCGSWSACAGNYQSRTCTDSNKCGTTTGKPVTTQSCTSGTTCTPNWQCNSWTACSDGQQTRTCTDINGCGAFTTRPSQWQYCTPACTPNWQCGSWSTCQYNQQTRTCTDSNSCGTTSNKPAETQYCSINTCQNISIPGVAFSCVYGTAPYGIEGDFIISYAQYSSWVSTFGSQYTPQRDCGCGWYGQTATTMIRWGSCSSGTGCDSSKVPNELPRRTFTGYCYDSSEVDYVEWSSRLAKGESYEQAYQNTIENQKRIMMINNEKSCVQAKVYYIGGEAGSTNWMCPGDKYRLNPNSTAAEWQKWVNGAWTANFSDYTCQ